MELIEEIQQSRYLYDVIYPLRNFAEELLRSLNWFLSTTPVTHWMDCMTLGVVIASRCNLVLHTFDKNALGCFTHLPLRSPPIPVQEREEIAIARVGDHFVQVFLRPHYPISLIPTWWWEYSLDEARGWATSYNVRILLLFEVISPAQGTPGAQFGGNIY